VHVACTLADRIHGKCVQQRPVPGLEAQVLAEQLEYALALRERRRAHQMAQVDRPAQAPEVGRGHQLDDHLVGIERIGQVEGARAWIAGGDLEDAVAAPHRNQALSILVGLGHRSRDLGVDRLEDRVRIEERQAAVLGDLAVELTLVEDAVLGQHLDRGQAAPGGLFLGPRELVSLEQFRLDEVLEKRLQHVLLPVQIHGRYRAIGSRTQARPRRRACPWHCATSV
jgi:hypothetical protein